MATFIPPPIQFKRSITPGNKPVFGDLLQGEIAINLKDKLIYTSDSDGIVTVGGGGKLSQLQDVDVITNPPLHGQMLTWDSDSEIWLATYPQVGTEMRRDSFVATANQTDFLLSAQPSGEVQFIRNSITLNKTASYVDSDFITVKYVQANNGNQAIRLGDTVEITYIVSAAITQPSSVLDGGSA